MNSMKYAYAAFVFIFIMASCLPIKQYTFFGYRDEDSTIWLRRKGKLYTAKMAARNYPLNIWRGDTVYFNPKKGIVSYMRASENADKFCICDSSLIK